MFQFANTYSLSDIQPGSKLLLLQCLFFVFRENNWL